MADALAVGLVRAAIGKYGVREVDGSAVTREITDAEIKSVAGNGNLTIDDIKYLTGQTLTNDQLIGFTALDIDCVGPDGSLDIDELNSLAQYKEAVRGYLTAPFRGKMSAELANDYFERVWNLAMGGNLLYESHLEMVNEFVRDNKLNEDDFEWLEMNEISFTMLYGTEYGDQYTDDSRGESIFELGRSAFGLFSRCIGGVDLTGQKKLDDERLNQAGMVLVSLFTGKNFTVRFIDQAGKALNKVLKHLNEEAWNSRFADPTKDEKAALYQMMTEGKFGELLKRLAKEFSKLRDKLSLTDGQLYFLVTSAWLNKINEAVTNGLESEELELSAAGRQLEAGRRVAVIIAVLNAGEIVNGKKNEAYALLINQLTGLSQDGVDGRAAMDFHAIDEAWGKMQ